MATNNTRRITLGLFALLLVANIATIAIFWRDRSGLRRRDHSPGLVRRLLVEELNFNAEQSLMYDSMVAVHRELSDSLRKAISRSKRIQYEALKDGDVSDSTLALRAAKTAALVQQLELVTLLHFRDVRAICSPGQRARFDGLLQEVSMRMGPEGRPPHGPSARP